MMRSLSRFSSRRTGMDESLAKTVIDEIVGEVRTPEEFLEFIRARRPDPATGEPDPARIGAFVAAHPQSLTALGAVMSALPTDSYLSCEYNALHTYLFEDATEKVRPGRYHLEP